MVLGLPVIYNLWCKERIILFLCALLLASQILDATSYAFFYAYVAPFSEATEQNPIVNFIASIGGPTLVVAIKLFIGYRIFSSARLMSVINYRITKVFVYTLLPLGAISGLIGFIANTGAILESIP